MQDTTGESRTLGITPGLQFAPGADGTGCLVRIHPPAVTEGSLLLAGSQVVIGRDEDCDVPVVGNEISRRHARITCEDGTYTIEDLKSQNGTYVNDVKVTKHVLTPGDLIRIGHLIYKFLHSNHIELAYHDAMYGMMVNDGLTSARNKRYFTEVLEREVARASRHGRELALAMLDVDHFKAVNDTYGHLAGDVVLRTLCARISPFVRREELLARYGGEEFAILLPETSKEEAVLFARRIRESIVSKPFEIEDLLLPVTVSIGIAEVRSGALATPVDLIEAADRKLYEAKQAGRDRIVS